MKTAQVIGSGIAGAATVTLLHESIKKFVPDAPRLDILGMQALKKTINAAGGSQQETDGNAKETPETNNKLYNQALAGELLANSLFYSMTGSGWVKGLILGVGAGLATVYLPKELGLDESTASRTPQTTAITIALYALGGIAAGLVGSLFKSNGSYKKGKDYFDIRNTEENFDLRSYKN